LDIPESFDISKEDSENDVSKVSNEGYIESARRIYIAKE
jgi:hypothetical protein